MSEVGESKFSLVKKIQELFKLGDAGKLDSFFSRVENTLNRDIKHLNANKATLKVNLEIEIEEKQDSLQDAENALEEVYLDVPVERIGSNANEKEYMEVYFAKIRKAEEVKSGIEEEITALKDSYEAEIKDIDAQISKIKIKLVKITG